MKLWLEEMPLSQLPYSFDEIKFENEQNVDQFSEEDLPIWLAAQRVVNRYEGILSSLGPRSRLLRKFLTWMELIPSMPKRPSKLEPDVNSIESHLRERPKFQIKEDGETIRTGTQALGEASGTVKVTRNPKVEDTVRASSQVKTQKSAGWDFSIGGSSSTGTVRSVVKPPQARERRAEVSHPQALPRRTSESGNRWPSSGSTNNISEVLIQRDARDPLTDEKQDYYHEDDDLAASGTGTVVVRSPRGVKSSSLFSDQSTLVAERCFATI